MTHLILFDGICGLCNRVNRFVIARDPDKIFAFASLQSHVGKKTLLRFGKDPRIMTTFFVVADYETPNERLLDRSEAAWFILKHLPGTGFGARCLARLPTWFLNTLYRLVARNRYWIFGRFTTCPLPSPEMRDRFMDL